MELFIDYSYEGLHKNNGIHKNSHKFGKTEIISCLCCWVCVNLGIIWLTNVNKSYNFTGLLNFYMWIIMSSSVVGNVLKVTATLLCHYCYSSTFGSNE